MKKYNSYNREILAELVPEKVLDAMDKLYTKAKFMRVVKKYGKMVCVQPLTKRK